jgi:subtilisin-like proprotein convertase family protein
MASFFDRFFPSRRTPQPIRRSEKGRSKRMGFETLEDRTVPATLPPALVTPNTTPVFAGASSPQIAVDPLNAQNMVAIATTGAALSGVYSNDGGTTWINFAAPSSFRDPNLAQPPFPAPPINTDFSAITDPSITFDRTGRFYVTASYHDATYTSGAVRVSRFDMRDGSPSSDFNSVVYRWFGTDPAFNPVVAVDTNEVLWTDPETGATKVDPLANSVVLTHNGQTGPDTELVPRGIYVAWNANLTLAAGNPFGATMSRVFVAASGDGGRTFTTQQAASGNNVNAANPVITFSGPGATGSADLMIFWNQGTGIVLDRSDPTNGITDNGVVATAQEFTNNFPVAIQDATQNFDATPTRQLPDTPQQTSSSINVNIDAQGLTTIKDVDVTVNITHQDLSQLRVDLVPPVGSGLPTIPLILNRVNSSGAVISAAQGITGTNLGVLTSTGNSVGTVFDQEAMRSINAGSGPFVGHFTPDTGLLSALYNQNASLMNGTWRLRVTDNFSSATNGATTTGTIQSWSIKFTGRISTPGFFGNAFSAIELPVATSLNQTNTQTGAALTAAGTPGIGSGLSVAVDRSLGAYSPHAGRIYVAYNAGTLPDSDVYVAYSDNGILWQTTKINDDAASDNMSEGTRSQLMPTIAVDPGTGTLVATYYDARWDAANARTTTMVTTSIDGGASFGKSTYLNATKTAVDLITGSTVNIEPMPGNAAAAGTSAFGLRQGLAVQDGRVVALFASNQNAAGVNVYTADVTFAAGPRVVSGDMGPILDESVAKSVNANGNTTGTYVYNAGVVVPPNEVRNVQFTGTVNGGFFTIKFRNATTSQIPYFATPATVQASLEALSTVGTGNVQVTGVPGAWVVTFVNQLGGQDIADADMTAASVSLIGTNPGVTVTTNTNGSTYAGGTRQLDGFQITFDRRIDPTTFDYRDIEMYFRSPTTPGSQLGTPLTVNETQTLTITGGPAGGSFTLTFGAATTGNIPYNASAVQIQAALEALSTIGKNNVKVTGNAGGPFAVTFQGDLAATDVAPLVADSSGLTGGVSPNVGVAETTKGSTVVQNVIALDNSIAAGGATTFLVKLTPQSAVGTYSYMVGPNVRDKFRHRDSTIQSPTYAAPFNASGAGIGAINPSSTNNGYKEFTLDLTAAGLTGNIVDLNVRFTGTGNGIRNSDIYLEAPDGTRVPLALQNSAIVDGSAVTFDDQATYSLAIAGGAGSVKPSGSLSSFNKTAAGANGIWKLIVINESNSAGNVDAWGLDIATDATFGNDVISNAGNWMDQNQNAIQREYSSGDLSQTITVSGNPTGGTFRLVYGSEFVDVPYSTSNNTTRNAILAALESLTAIAPGDVSVANSTGNSWIVTFSRSFSRTALSTLVVDGSGLTGGSNPSVLVTSKSRWDVFAAPAPNQSENPYFPSFDNRTSPLSIPGAHLVASATYESAATDYNANQLRDANVAGPNGAGVTYSDIVIADDGTGSVLTDLNVEVLLDHASINDLRLTLIAPDGTQVQLANRRGNLFGGSNDRYADVTFDDAANRSIALYSGISGSYRPEVSLTNMLGKKLVGTWRLMIEDLSNGGNGNSQLVKWSLQPRTALYLNAVANYIDVTFDRDIDVSTFTSADIVSVTGPNGAITGTFGVASNPQGTPAGQERRRFRITFPTGQAVPGWYNMVLGSDIKDTQGNRVDNNLNAGLDVLRSIDPSTAAVASWNIHNYSSTASYVAIPANSTVESTLKITDNFVIQRDATNRIQVTMNVTFPDVRDLDISLVAPNGTVIRLSRGADLVQNQANVQNFQGTVLDDADTLNGITINPIQSAQAPYAPPVGGAYKPVDSLFPLVGLNSFGTWRLRVTNNGSQTGTIGYNNSFWSLKLPEAIAGSGLGETAADRATVSFRVFVGDSTNPLSSQTWTGTGPFTAENQTNAGSVRTIAVDPSDPSGNTVFLGAADGGVWKTTNFLTDSSAGPTWIPLTDLGPVRGFRSTSITVVGRNGDPSQSIVFVGTGDYFTSRGGTGLLRSADGGKTWTIIGDQANGEVKDTTGASITLTGAIVNKIVADPTPQSGSQSYILYAAISGTNGGLYRSTDSGLTWQQVRAGNATDVTLVPTGLKDTNGNLLQLWAAFQNDGIYSTSFATTATSLTIQSGGGGVNTRTNNGNPLPVSANTISLAGKGRVLISAVQPSTSNTLGNSLYAGWLYAAVVSATGSLELYMTKDYGQNWTRAVLPISVPVAPATATYASNNENNAQVDPFNGQGNFQSSLAIDPTNPNVVFVGGNRVIRVDTTTMADAYALINYDESDPGAGVVESASTGSVNPVTHVLRNGFPISTDYYNLIRHPDNVLNPNSGTNITLDALGTFVNNGTDLKWQAVTAPSTGLLPLSVQQMIVRTDPTTGERRIYYATATGVYTNVIDSTGAAVTSQGSQSIVSGARNSNLQIDTVSQGTVIASVTGARAADVFGAAFSSVNQLTGLPDDWMRTGNLISTQISSATGAAVQAVLDGSGDWYQYINPSYLTSLPVPQSAGNFFQYADNSVTDTTYIRNGGTLLSGSTGGAAQWSSYTLPVTDPYPLSVSLSKPAIGQNPWDGSSVLLGSPQGRVYLSTGNSLQGKGQVWITVASQGQLSGANAVSAVAFGAPDTGSANLNSFMYAGTQNGQVFVTTTGGSTWTNITGNLTGGQILGIYTNPNRGSREVYAITTTGMWQLPDSSTGTTWTQLNDVAGKGNLLTATRNIFGDSTNTEPAMRYLTTMAIDWRFAIPNGTGGTFPVLYAAGHGGVYRSIDFGTTWKPYPENAPSVTTNPYAIAAGGLLPNIPVLDLNLATGGINYATGFPDQSTAQNVLVAHTLGRGDFSIRLNNADVQQYSVVPNKGPRVLSIAAVNPNPGNTITGIDITFAGAVDPYTFTSADVEALTGPNNVSVAVGSITSLNPATNGDKVYRVLFATPQTVSGTYSIALGKDIADYSGNLMNQDNNNVNGQSTDKYSGSFTIQLNLAPVFSAIADVITQPNVATTPFTFTVTDPDPLPTVSVVVTSSSNPTLAPLANISLTPQGNGVYQLIITPAANQYGVSVITLTATDGRGLSTTKTFNFIVDTAPTVNFATDPLTTPHRPFSRTDSFTFTDAEQDTVSFGTPTVAASGPAATLQTQFQFYSTGNNYFSSYGQNEKWFKSQTNGSWYFITPDGKIRRDGGSFGASTLVAPTLSYAYWNDNTLLFNALNAPALNVTVQNLTQANGNGSADLVIDNTTAPNFVGSVDITLPYSDGFLQRTKTLTVTFTNSAPSVQAVSSQSVTHLAGTLSVPMQVTDAESDPIAYTGTSLDALAYRLDSRYDFFFTGNSYQNNNGLNEKWFRSLTQSAWFYITPNGNVYRGGAANPFAQLDATYWVTPAKLLDASQKSVSFVEVLSNDDAARLDRQYDFYFTGGYSQNYYGQSEKWFRSAIDNSWFFILPTGEVRKDGGSFAASTIVPASLDSSFYFDPMKLINGSTNAAPAVTATPNNPNLDLAWNANSVSGKALVSVFASDGIAGTLQSFALDVTNQTPTISPIADRTGANAYSHNAGTVQIPLTVSDADIDGLSPDDTLTYTVTFSPNDAYDLDQQLQLVQQGGTYYYNSSGQFEKWVYSQTNNAWYTLLPNGDFKLAVGALAQWTLVKNLDVAYYNDPSLLHDATSKPLPAGLANFTGNVTGSTPNPTLNINIPATFVGTAKVTVKVSDGVGGTATQSFFLEANNPNAPIITVIPAGPHTVANGNTLTLNVNTADADGDATTTTIEAVGHLGVAVKAQYQLTADASYYFNSSGFSEKWLRSAVVPSGWVYIKPDGSIWQWGKTVADSQLTTVDRVFYDDPRLLTSPSSKQGLAYDLDRFGSLVYYPQYDNYNNLNARWFLSSSNLWYYVMPNGDFVRSGVGTLTTLPTSFHTTPLSLQNAYAVGNPAQFDATLTGGTQLDVSAGAGYLGDIWVLLKATDGNKVTYQTVKVTSN